MVRVMALALTLFTGCALATAPARSVKRLARAMRFTAAPLSVFRRHLRQVREPGARAGVGGRAPVAARRERAARADFRRVGRDAALELVAEEAAEEHAEPFPDRREPVFALPRVHRKESDLCWRVAEAQDVVEVEILQLVGADPVLGALRARDECRVDLVIEDPVQRTLHVGAELARLRHPAHER